jgi:hypothetical protein
MTRKVSIMLLPVTPRLDAATRTRRLSRRLLLTALTFVLALLAVSGTRPTDAKAANVLWGAYISGTTYGYGDAPFDTRSIDSFEADAGKKVSIVHWGQPWYWGSHGGYQPFQRAEAEAVRQRGSIPMITWTSADHDKGGSLDQPSFRLANITAGAHDAYLRQWADDAKAWGHPLMVRFDNEMNGNWFLWSEPVNGNSTGQFVPMWRHVVDIFRQEGATNVTWVWAPNRTWPAAPRTLAQVYPGANYVDWVGLSAYNWGTNPAKPKNAWQDFNAVFKDTYDQLQALAPDKPVMIAETASTEYGGSKAAWITDALQTQLPINYPNIKALVWFNWNVAATSGNMDWVVESSPAANAAFRAGIASSYYADNSFANLPLLTPVAPLPGNEVRNGSFEPIGLSPWFSPWTLRNDLGAALVQDAGTATSGAASLRVDLPAASPATPWAVQVRQSPFGLTATGSYTLSFWAKASAPRPVTVLLQGSLAPWPVYVTRTASLTTGWVNYVYVFTAPASDPKGMIAINLAAATGSVWLDDVSLTRS